MPPKAPQDEARRKDSENTPAKPIKVPAVEVQEHREALPTKAMPPKAPQDEKPASSRIATNSHPKGPQKDNGKEGDNNKTTSTKKPENKPKPKSPKNPIEEAFQSELKKIIDHKVSSAKQSPPDACSLLYGMGLIKRLRDGNTTVCPGTAAGTSRVRCYPNRGTRTVAKPSSYCDMTNVALDGGLMEVGKLKGIAGEDGHFKYKEGALSVVGCTGDDLKQFGKVPIASQYKGLINSAKTVESLGTCNETIEEPVVALTRNEWAHLLFTACHALNVDIISRVLGLEGKPFRVLFLDSHPMGPFTGLFEALTPGFSVMSGDTLLTKGKRRVCFRRLIVSVTGYNNFMESAATGNPLGCRENPLVVSFRDKIVKHFHHDSIPYPTTPTAIFVSRRPYAHTGFNKSTINRVVLNEKDVEAAVQKQSDKYKIRFVDFATLSFSDQIKVVHSSNILVGVHGAGLVHSLFLPPNSILIEIRLSGSGSNHRNQNIAHHAGALYYGFNTAAAARGNVNLPIETFTKVMLQAVKTLKVWPKMLKNATNMTTTTNTTLPLP